MSKSILDEHMICPVTGEQVFSDAVYMNEDDGELKCPCHNMAVQLTKPIEEIEAQAVSQDPCDYDECPFKAIHQVDGFSFCKIHRNEYANIQEGRQPDEDY